MTNVEYAFNADVAAKKRIARGAYAKKTHNGKAGCRLPSDSLTAAQKAKLNGEVRTFSLIEPMDYELFKTLAEADQRSYLRFLRTEYRARPSHIGRMLGVSESTVYTRLRALGLTGEKFPKHRMSREEREKWEAFLDRRSPQWPDGTETFTKRIAGSDADIYDRELAETKQRELETHLATAPEESTTATVPEEAKAPAEEVRAKLPTASWEDLFLAAKLVGERYGVKVQVVVG